jgi:MSHA biogenesis protein MshQ
VLDFQLLNSTSNTDTIIVEFSGSSSYSSSVIPGSGSGPSNGNRYQANSSGLLQIGLSDNTVGTVSVYTYIEGQESATNQSGSYKFVPNKFAITDAVQSVIANQASDIQIQAMQCNASGDPVAIPADEYSGEQTLSISTTTYDEPSNDNVRVTEAVVVQDKDDNWVAAPSPSLTLSFSSAGIANTKVRYTEAGTISYNLSDQVCITNDAGEQECEEIVGLQQLNARPWTFAICHDSKTLAGTSKSGVTTDDALVEAGSSFDLLLHPLRYVDDEPDPLVISVGTYCDELRTENFFSSDAPLASVTIDSSNVALHTPENGSLGTGLEGLTTLTNRGVTELRMSGLSWKDVGSLTVQTQGTFLGTVKPGTRSIGRFYPAYLSLNDETNHPSEHSSFAYLGQPLDHKFWVYAHESGGDPVSNYHLFNETFASKVSYIARSNSVEDLTDRLYDGSTKIATEYALGQGELGMVGGTDPDAQLAVEFTKFEFVRAPIGATTTTPEEPFTNTNTDFGLDVSTVVDDATWQVPIELTTNIKQFNPFIDDYDYRYGRMVLRDVGGNSGATIQVPLQVEFLSGGKFIINEDDGNSTLLGSDYNGAYFCSQRIWPGDSDPIAELDGKGAVVSGVAVEQTGPDSEFLFATHNNTSAREQTRLWLRIGAIAPQEIDSDPIVDCSRSSSPGNYTNRPWLKYDWRSIGDEDPSVVVTFGTHRGNDRIIYRGEPNLAGN